MLTKIIKFNKNNKTESKCIYLKLDDAFSSPSNSLSLKLLILGVKQFLLIIKLTATITNKIEFKILPEK